MSIIVLKDGLAALKVHLNQENKICGQYWAGGGILKKKGELKYVDNIVLEEGFWRKKGKQNMWIILSWRRDFENTITPGK